MPDFGASRFSWFRDIHFFIEEVDESAGKYFDGGASLIDQRLDERLIIRVQPPLRVKFQRYRTSRLFLGTVFHERKDGERPVVLLERGGACCLATCP